MWGILTWLSPALVTPFSRDPRDNGLPRFNVNDSVIIRTTVNVTRDAMIATSECWGSVTIMMMSWLLADGIIQHLYRIERKEGTVGNLNICCWHLSPAAHFFQLSPKDLYIWGFKPQQRKFGDYWELVTWWPAAPSKIILFPSFLCHKFLLMHFGIACTLYS